MASSCKAAARRLVRLFITKLSFVINQTNLLFDFFLSLPTTVHFLAYTSHGCCNTSKSNLLSLRLLLFHGFEFFLIKIPNRTCSFWSLTFFTDSTFLDQIQLDTSWALTFDFFFDKIPKSDLPFLVFDIFFTDLTFFDKIQLDTSQALTTT